MVKNRAELHETLTQILQAGGIPDAPLEAQWILEDAKSEADAWQIARKRANHEPLQYLLGKWEFYGLPLFVGKGVLIPRADTETLVDAILQRTSKQDALQIIDLCTGSGCIALALKKHLPRATVCGVDLSTQALAYAEKNARLHDLDIALKQADVCSQTIADAFENVDVIVSNPPYLTAKDMQELQTEVTYEPALALAGGEDGLDFYRAITKIWRDSLKPDGMLAFEVGIRQAESVQEILEDAGFSDVTIIPDLCGVPRVVLGKRKL